MLETNKKLDFCYVLAAFGGIFNLKGALFLVV